MAEYPPDEIARLERLYSSNPGGRVFTHLAEAYRKTGELARAREILEDGLRRHDGYASAHVVLGRVLSGLGDSDGAAREFRRVLELDPENLIALQALAQHAQRRGQSEDALQYLRRLAQLDPGAEDVQESISRLERDAAASQHGMGGFHDPFAPRSPSYDAPQPTSLNDAPAFQPLDHLFGADLGMPADAYGTNEDPFASLGGDWTGGEPAGPASQEEAAGETDAAGDERGERPDEGWPPLDASEAPALRFDWGIRTGGDAPAERGAAEPETKPEGQPAAEWLSSINADWDTPAGLGFPMETAPPAADPAEAERSETAAAGEEERRQDAAVQEERGDAAAPTYDGTADDEQPAGDAPFAPIDGGELLPDAAETEVYTETLAELYRAQGFPERAIGVYRSLLADRPGDQRLMQKLREMEGVLDAAVAAPGDERAAAQWAQVADDMERAHGAEDATTPARPDADEPHHADTGDEEPRAAEPEAADIAARAADAAAAESAGTDAAEAEDAGMREQWLERVEAAWTGSAGATGAGSAESPYAWTEKPAESGGSGEGTPIRLLLGALLAWRPTRGADGEPEEELLLLDEVSADFAGTEAAQLEGGAADDASAGEPEAAGQQAAHAAGEPSHAGDAAPAAEADAAEWTPYAQSDERAPSHAADPADEPRGDDTADGEVALGDGMPGLEPAELARSVADEPAARQDRAEPAPAPVEAAADEAEAARDPWADDADLRMPWESESTDADAGDAAAGAPAGERADPVEPGPADTAPGAEDGEYVPMPWEADASARSDPWDAQPDAQWPAGGRGGAEAAGAAASDAARAEPRAESARDEAPEPARAEGSADEDDDLELFRSWLQSLKK